MADPYRSAFKKLEDSNVAQKNYLDEKATVFLFGLLTDLSIA
jgi:hypothetical protein